MIVGCSMPAAKRRSAVGRRSISNARRVSMPCRPRRSRRRSGRRCAEDALPRRSRDLRLSADRLLTMSYAAAAVGAGLVLAGHGIVWPTVIGLTVLGFAFGPLYPTMMAVVTAASPQAAGAAASRIGVLASIGGMILPSLHGFLIARIGTFTSAAVTAVIVMSHVSRVDGDQAPLRRDRVKHVRNERLADTNGSRPQNHGSTTGPRWRRLTSGCRWRACARRARTQAARAAAEAAAWATRATPGRLGWPGCPGCCRPLR